MRSSPLLCKIGSAVKRSRSGYYASLRQTWLYRLQAFTGAAPQPLRGRGLRGAPEPAARRGGKRRFGADRPNELRITDVTEFRIPAGKACLSPIVGCLDGLPLSWSISTSPDAEMANSPPIGACGWLNEGDHPTARSDRSGAVAGRDGFGPRSPPQHLAVGGGNIRQREGAGIFIPAPSIKLNGIVARYCALSFELLGDEHCGAGKPSSCWESR